MEEPKKCTKCDKELCDECACENNDTICKDCCEDDDKKEDNCEDCCGGGSCCGDE